MGYRSYDVRVGTDITLLFFHDILMNFLTVKKNECDLDTPHFRKSASSTPALCSLTHSLYIDVSHSNPLPDGHVAQVLAEIQSLVDALERTLTIPELGNAESKVKLSLPGFEPTHTDKSEQTQFFDMLAWEVNQDQPELITGRRG